ncbi:MFS transporter [Kineococcus gynurae]|uniref:MFS transporter n=1 Tax=Kineococcus gynurae TaxID=452979 RepID=A0ABV5LSP5_9ACTN
MRRGILLVVALTACSMRAPLTGVGPLVGRIGTDTGLTAAALGALTTLPLLAFAGASLFVARLAARWGLLRTLLLALALLVTASGLRWVPGVAPLFAGTLLLGIAIAVVNVLLPALLRSRFPDRVATLTSGYVVAMGLVGSAASGLAVPLAQGVPGQWRTALAVWAVPALLAALVLTGPARRDRPTVRVGPRRAAPWGSVQAWWVTAFMGLQSATFYVLLAWLPSIVTDRAGVGEVAAGWQLSIVQGAGVVAGLLVPVLARGVRATRRLAVGASAATTVGFGLLLLVPQVPSLAALVVGAGGGATVVLALSAISARAADVEGAAALSGMAQSVGYALAAAGPVVMGALHAATGSWTLPLLLAVLLSAVMVLSAAKACRDRTV